MQQITLKEHNERIKENGRQSAQKFGERLLKRAEALVAKGVKPPFNLMEITTTRYKVQINYFGEKGLSPIVVLDTEDTFDGKPNGHTVDYFGDAEATVMSVLSQLSWIDYIHYKDID